VRSLSIDQLRSFATVIELGSYSAAARRLGITQAAVSLQLRELEARCGLELVERIGRKVLPTMAGRELLVHAERIGREADLALAAMRIRREGYVGRVRVAAGPSALAYLLRPVLQRLRTRYPGIELIVTFGQTQDIAERILAGTLDLGFTALPAKGEEIIAIPVRTDRMVAILPASETDIPDVFTPADVQGRTLITEFQRVAHPQLSRAWIRAGGFEARPALEFDSIEPVIDAVAAGLGMSIVPAPAIDFGPLRSNIVVRPLAPPLIRTLGLLQRSSRSDDPVLGVVRDAIMTLANLPAESLPTKSLPAKSLPTKKKAAFPSAEM